MIRFLAAVYTLLRLTEFHLTMTGVIKEFILFLLRFSMSKYHFYMKVINNYCNMFSYRIHLILLMILKSVLLSAVLSQKWLVLYQKKKTLQFNVSLFT